MFEKPSASAFARRSFLFFFRFPAKEHFPVFAVEPHGGSIHSGAAGLRLVQRVEHHKIVDHGREPDSGDFRPGFREGQNKAREMGLYMQKYSGCVFSEEERYAKQIKRDRERSV